MTWITFLWPMVTGACITMASIHLWIGLRRTSGSAHQLFALCAFLVALFSVLELAMITADSADRYLELQRWTDFTSAALVTSLAAFAWAYFGAGRKWLALLAFFLVWSPMMLDLTPVPGLVFLEFTGIRNVETFGGATYAVAQGTPNPWNAVFYLGVVLIALFVVDVSATAWRRGERLRATRVGGSITFFLLAAGLQAGLVDSGVMVTPYLVSFFYLAILFALGMELSDAVLRSSQLADDLHESEARMSLAADAAGVAVWSWDIQSNRIWGSEHWRRVFGFAPHEAPTYERLIERIHPQDRERTQQEMQHALARRTAYAGEFRVGTAAGGQRWIGARARIAGPANDDPLRMLGAAIDISERKESERKLDQQRSQLAQLSRITMLGELSGSLAHELNQPLGIILANAQAAQRLLAQDPPDLAEVRDILADIVSEDQRAGQVIRRMRAMLKGEAVKLQPLAIHETIDTVLQLLRTDLIDKGIAVKRGFAARVPLVLGDHIQLQQVLLNLILNACDAMAADPPEGRHLRIATTHREGLVCVAVADTGHGLPAQIERVFEPFHSTKKDGMGLGLSICRAIVDAHNGRLWAQTEAATDGGRGATFHLELPALEGASGADPTAGEQA